MPPETPTVTFIAMIVPPGSLCAYGGVRVKTLTYLPMSLGEIRADIDLKTESQIPPIALPFVQGPVETTKFFKRLQTQDTRGCRRENPTGEGLPLAAKDQEDAAA